MRPQERSAIYLLRQAREAEEDPGREWRSQNSFQYLDDQSYLRDAEILKKKKAEKEDE